VTLAISNQHAEAAGVGKGNSPLILSSTQQPAMMDLSLPVKMGGKRVEEEGAKKGRRRKEEESLEDSYLRCSTDACLGRTHLFCLTWDYP
jgi:hypothetical protein